MTGVDLFPQLAKDAELQVRTALAIALRQHLGVSLTATRARKPIGLPPHGTEALEVLMGACKDSQEPLPFHIWMALEPSLGERPAFPIELLVRTAPTTHPLSRVLSHKAMRRLCDTRKAENLDLAVEFCDKIAEHDILLAHALDGLVKGQEGDVIKPVKEVSASLAKWRSSSNAEVRKHVNRAQTILLTYLVDISGIHLVNQHPTFTERKSNGSIGQMSFLQMEDYCLGILFIHENKMQVDFV